MVMRVLRSASDMFSQPRLGDQVFFHAKPGQPLPVPEAVDVECMAFVCGLNKNGTLNLHVIGPNGMAFGAMDIPAAAQGKAVGWYWPPHIRV